MNQFWGTVFVTVLILGIIAGAWGWVLVLIRKGPRGLLGYEKVTLSQFENAVVYKDGQFERVLAPGIHWLHARNRRLFLVDTRPEIFRLEQMSVTADHFTAAMRYVARVQIRDPGAVIALAQNQKDEIATRIQLTVKKLGETQTIRELCTGHDAFNAKAQELATRAIADAGYECIGFEILEVEPRGAITEMASRKVGFTS